VKAVVFGSAALGVLTFLGGALAFRSPAGILADTLMAVALSAVFFQGFLTVRAFRATSANDETADLERARVQAYDAVRAVMDGIPTGYPHADAPNLGTAQFVLAEARTGFERTDQGSDNIESKATTLISIVAGATSALGVFGISKEGRAIVATPLILLAFLFAALALGALLYVVRSKKFLVPSVAPFISLGIVAEDNRVAIALLLTRAYHESAESLRRAIRYEPLALFIAYVAVATAAGLVLLNAASAIPWWNGGPAVVASPSPSPSVSGKSQTQAPAVLSPSASARPQPSASSKGSAAPSGSPTTKVKAVPASIQPRTPSPGPAAPLTKPGGRPSPRNSATP
jgi:hypothetical protein